MNKSVAFAVLAGGKSSRMGQNKALLPVDGRIMLEKILAEGSAFTERMLSVDSRQRYQNVDFAAYDKLIVVEDEQKEYGPLEGIYQLLLRSHCDYVLCAATDMPMVSQAFLEKWADRADGKYDCYVLTLEDGHPEPLLSIYGKSCLAELGEMRSRQEHKPRLLFERVKSLYVNIKDLGFEEDILSNVNTPEEYERMLHRRSK